LKTMPAAWFFLSAPVVMYITPQTLCNHSCSLFVLQKKLLK
jgi:hypothetical protein